MRKTNYIHTPEEKQEIQGIIDKTRDLIGTTSENHDTPRGDTLRELQRLQGEYIALLDKGLRRYITYIKKHPDEAKANALDIISVLEKEDFTHFVTENRKTYQNRAQRLKRMQNKATDPATAASCAEEIARIKKYLSECCRLNYKSAYIFLLSCCVPECAALKNDTDLFEEIVTAAESKAALFYKPSEKEKNASLTDLEIINDVDTGLSADPLLPSERISYFTPKSHIIPNNKLMNELQTGEIIGAGARDLIVSNKSATRKEITSYTMVAFTGSMKDITKANLTEFDRQVSDAVVSLWCDSLQRKSSPIYTRDAIYSAMPGGGDRCSDKMAKDIDASIEKFRQLKIEIDATDELRARGLQGTLTYNEYYLNVGKATYTPPNGGKPVEAYKVLSEPVIFKYCKVTNQYSTIPSKYIVIYEIDDGKLSNRKVAMSADRQAITGYLLRRISVMKNDAKAAAESYRKYNARRKKDETLPYKAVGSFSKQSKTILFSTLFSDIGMPSPDKTTAMRHRKFIFLVLDNQKAHGNIAGYTVIKDGTSISGIEIKLPKVD